MSFFSYENDETCRFDPAHDETCGFDPVKNWGVANNDNLQLGMVNDNHKASHSVQLWFAWFTLWWTYKKQLKMAIYSEFSH